MTNKEARADMSKQISDLKAKFAARAKQSHSNVYAAVANSCRMVEDTAKRLMTEAEVDVSKTYGTHGHHPSVPGSAPAVDFGTLRRSITHDVEETESGATGHVGSIITDPPYGSYLETGTSKMLPRPWLKPALEQNMEAIKKAMSASIEDRVVTIEGGNAGE